MELPKLNLISSNNNLVETLESKASNYDGLIVFFTEKEALYKVIPCTKAFSELDATLGESLQLVLPENGQPHKRVLIAPTGTLYNDFDDARRFKDAAYNAGLKAIKVGMKNPLVCFADEPTFERSDASFWTFGEDVPEYKHFIEVTLLGLLEASFEPVDVRRHAERTQKPIKTLESIDIVANNIKEQEQLIQYVSAMEAGRRLTKDIGNPDPEIMSPINITKYVEEQFASIDNVKVTVISDIEEIKKNYPLAHAVTRASLAVERHHPRVIHFEYISPDQSKVKEK